MQRWLVLIFLAFPGVVASEELPRSKPEQQGLSSAAVLSFIETVDEKIDSLHGFMLLRHGHIVAEGYWSPYNAESPHMLFSLSKSFTSTAVGLAVAEGKLSVDDEVLKFFPEAAPAERSANLKAMRVSDLLRMSTGQQTEPPRPVDQSWVKTFLAHPVPFKPGTHFQYNTSATYMQSAVVQKATGQTLLEYLQPRLFQPLGIEHPTWEMSPEGIATGGYGLSIRTKDIASFGQLYLQNGKWKGKQLVPEAWVAAATARQTSNGSNPSSDWDQGYGYQFWRCRHGAYRGDGAFGQYCIVLPEQDAVIAINSGLRDMQAVLNHVWEKLLPAMQPEPLPADEAATAKLEQKLRSLMLPPQKGTAEAKVAAGRKYVFPENDRKLQSVQLESKSAEEQTFVTQIEGTEYRIDCPRNRWSKGKMPWSKQPVHPAAASGAWTEEDTFSVKLCFYETPYVFNIRLKFTGNELQLSSESNVGFGGTKDAPLVGKAE
jgi:CubicO group peptidase (beta-lactamase class C family)